MKRSVFSYRSWRQFSHLLLFMPCYIAACIVGWLSVNFSGSPELAVVVRHFFCIPVIVVSAIIYGVTRVSHVHPAAKSAYAQWLRSTPWQFPAALPLGPIHLVWQDLAFLFLLSALTYFHLGLDPMLPILFFAISYAVVAVVILHVIHRRWEFWALAFGFPTIILLWPQHWALGFNVPGLVTDNPDMPIAQLVAHLPASELIAPYFLIVTLYFAGFFGLRGALRTFPWPVLERSRDGGGNPGLAIGALSPAPDAGWPFRALSPAPISSVSPWPGAFRMAALVGWTVFCCAARFTEPLNADIFAERIGLGMVPCAALAFIRLVRDIRGHLPPISLLGRFATRHLIIPGYDQIFLAPLTIVAVGGVVPGLGVALGLPLAPAVACSAFFGVLCFLGLPPSRERWRLTAPARLVRGQDFANASQGQRRLRAQR